MPDSEEHVQSRQAVSPGLAWFARILALLCILGVVVAIGGAAAATFDLIPVQLDAPPGSGVALFDSAVSIDDPSRPDAMRGLLRDPVFMIARLAPLGFLVWALMSARVCFIGLARGEWFARRTVTGLRNLSLATLLFMTLAPIIVGLGRLPYLSGFEHGSFSVGINLHAGNILMLVFTGVVLVVSSAMRRAAAIAEENEQFV